MDTADRDESANVIEIDNLHISYETRKGDVEAIQGDMYLNADVIKVYYQGSSDDSAESDAGFGGSVSRIDTSGNVQIESRGDTATADWAVYDVTRRLVTMGGAVVLERDESVLKGTRLELDLDSGRSTMRSASTTGAGDDRVRGEFTPAETDGTGQP